MEWAGWSRLVGVAGWSGPGGVDRVEWTGWSGPGEVDRVERTGWSGIGGMGQVEWAR